MLFCLALRVWKKRSHVLLKLQTYNSFTMLRLKAPVLLGFRQVERGLCTMAKPTVLYTWGDGTEGQLGHAKFELKNDGIMSKHYIQEEPRKLVKSKKFQQVAIGTKCTFAVSNTNDLYACGEGFLDGKVSCREPTPIAPDLKVKFVASGQRHHALIDMDGQVYTWGHGGSWLSGGGQLGHDNTERLDKPKMIEAFKDYGVKAKQVSLGLHHTVILTDDGEVLTCGVGEYGRLGTGNTIDALVPASLEALVNEDIVQIAAGVDHTLALTDKGAIFSWGRNQQGQLGHSDSYIDIYSMEDFPRLIDAESINNGENAEVLELEGESADQSPLFAQVSAGSGRSAGVTTQGLVYIWGHRVGHQPKLIPKSLFGGLRATKVMCGGEQGRSVFAVITEDQSLWTIGDGKSRMMGEVGLVGGKYPVPRQIKPLAQKVVDISCGLGQHMAAFVSMDEAD